MFREGMNEQDIDTQSKTNINRYKSLTRNGDLILTSSHRKTLPLISTELDYISHALRLGLSFPHVTLRTHNLKT